MDTEKYLSGDPRPLSLSSPLPGGGCRRANAQGYGCSPYWGAAALGKYVFFAPWSEDSVSPPRHSARTLQSAPVSQVATRDRSWCTTLRAAAPAGFEREGDKYLGAVAVGKCVYFVPYQVSKVGGVCCA